MAGKTASGATMDFSLSSSPTPSPLYAPKPVPISSSIATRTSPLPSLAVSPAPSMSSRSDDGSDEHILVLSDGDGVPYTTTVYSTQDPLSTHDSLPGNIHRIGQTGPPFVAIIAGVGGGVGLILLLVGVTWFICVRRARRRAGITLIKDRKLYPDRYNQTVTSNRHSEFNEVEPGPVVIQLPPPHPPPPLRIPRHNSSLSSVPLSRQTSSYQSHIPSGVHERWAGSPTDSIFEDFHSLTRHRVPYPSSPIQPLVDRYTALPSRSPSGPNSPVSVRFALNSPPKHPHHRSFTATHRRYHSHQSYHSRPNYHGYDLESDSHFPQVPTLHIPPQTPTPMRVARRYTIFDSPISPSSFTPLSSPPQDLLAERTTVTPTNRPSVGPSAFSSTDSLATVSNVTTTKRMMCTNPDSDIDLETDTEPEGPSGSGSRESPSATDIIQLYTRNLDLDTSPTNSVFQDDSSSTASINPIYPSAKSC